MDNFLDLRPFSVTTMGVSLFAFDVFMTEEGFAIGDDEAGDA